MGRGFLDRAGKWIFSGQKMADAFAPFSGQLKETECHALDVADASKVMAAASNLAEAAHESLGSSTTALSGIMQAYRLSVGQAAAASDQLFNVSKTINVPIAGVATAMERLHGRLGELAPSLSDVSGLLVDLAGHGVTGQKGVQVVNTALTTLVGNAKGTTAVLHALGVSVFDQNGKFIGLQSVISQLQPKLAGLTEQQRLFAEKALFGSAAGKLLGQVIADGVPKFQQSAAAATKAGTAQQAATLQSKTFHNELETLKATVLDLGAKFGLYLIPKLQAAGSALESGIKWMERHKAAAEALAGVIAGVLGAAVAYSVIPR
jgi:TP901 family phage tail tape measure protein